MNPPEVLDSTTGVLEPADATPVVTRPDYTQDDDWRWMQEERRKPDQGVFGLFAGLWVAVLDRQIVGAAAPGPAAMSLAERVSELSGVPPELVVVVGLSDPHVIEC